MICKLRIVVWMSSCTYENTLYIIYTTPYNIRNTNWSNLDFFILLNKFIFI